MGKIPSGAILKHRGINIGDIRCRHCNMTEKCSYHILIGCRFEKNTREWVFRWCGIYDVNMTKMDE